MEQKWKKTVAWALYDWGNSAFATVVIAGFFPIFFKTYWANPADHQQSTFYLGVANSLASVIIAALAPFLGAVADRSSARKRLLVLFAFLGILMTGALWFVRMGMWPLALVLYVVGSVGFSGGNLFYNSLLSGITSEDTVDFVSSLGFGLGYLGGGLLFLGNVILYHWPHLLGLPDGAAAIRFSFVSVAVWWGVFTVPLMLFVPEPRSESTLTFREALRGGWRQLRETLGNVRRLRMVVLFLVAYWFYIDGVHTVVRMAMDYGVALGFPTSSLIKALLLVQFVAFPAALGYGWLAGKIGVKRALYSGICAYCAVTVFGFFAREIWHFYVLAILIGLFQGGLQALSRSYYTRLIPEDKAGEFFGFYNMLGKFAAVVGPLLMGLVTLITDSNRVGILSLLLLFAVGGLILRRVDEEEGKRMAAEME